MKVELLAFGLVNLAIASAAIIDGATLTPLAGPNVQVATNGSTTVTTLVDYDFVIVGSGAGGGPLAARLAQAGFSVLLLEAGTDQTGSRVYTTPLGHPLATELVPMKWDFWVSPFGNSAEDARNDKLTYTLPDGSRYTGLNPPPGATPLGVLYPRAGTLGGCTAHNALISVTPHESDWTFLANLTGDKSWAPAEMRKYLIKLEKNNYLPRGTPGHGFNGWFETSLADPGIAKSEAKVDAIIKAAAYTTGNTVLSLAQWLLSDLNSASRLRDGAESLYRVPIAMTSDRKRSGPVDLLKATVDAKGKDGKPKYRLDIMLNTLVTKVRFDTKHSESPRAVGVEFELGESLYGADPRRQVGRVGKSGIVTARREVIISAGTFNTPQLLKLSGVGPAVELRKYGIPLVVDLPGVGTNLQDRYEAPVIVRADTPIASNAKCTFGLDSNDPCWVEYESGKGGLYASNGAPVAYTIKSSTAENGNADIFMAGFPGFAFTGYLPGWPFVAARSDSFTWLALKSHSRNTAGTVTLRSADPHDIPVIQLRNFANGGEADLSALIEGPNWARATLKNVARFDNTTKWTEVWPGPAVQSAKQMKDWAKYTTWGHHACCTAPIGKNGDRMAVLDSQFRVRGVTGLRVVDASSWAKIPGFYIVTPLYTLSEKLSFTLSGGVSVKCSSVQQAADVIIAANS